MMKRLLHTGLMLCMLIFVPGQLASQQNPSDTAWLRELVKYNDFYEFLQYDRNMLEWYQQDAVVPFFEKLKKSDKEKVVVLHIGDSHIQSDIGAGTTRNRLQQIFGYGGRGMVFPYQLAGTHSAYDYYAEKIGTWSSAKNVELKPKLNVGISGITIFTTDSTAGFRMVFRKHYYSIQPDFRKIRLYCHKGRESFDAKIRGGNSGEWIPVDCHSDSLPYAEVILPRASDTITVMVRRTSADQKYFECYGLDIESVSDKGVLYHSVGINGAGYHSFFNQNLMSDHLKVMKPDLIIFDLGINDFFRGAFNYQYVMSSLNKAIDFFRASAPQATILIPNSQDIYFRGVNIANCNDYSQLTRLVSKEQDVALYDYYSVSGGRYSMLNWSKTGLSQRDRTHLSYKGYQVKGELYCNAILNGYLSYLTRRPDSLVAFNDRIDTTNFAKWVINKSTYYNRQEMITTDRIDEYKNQTPTVTQYTGGGTTYVVRSGDNLSSIASRYGVSVSDIQRWNNLTSTNIYPGQKLVVSKSGSSGSTNQKNSNQTNQTTTNQTNTVKPGSKTVYTIKQGDNLGSIAKKFNVSVADIKRWNGLSSDNIIAGKTLIIYPGSGSTVKTSNTGTTQQTKTQSSGNSGSSKTKVHVVKSGESLWAIAQKYNTTVEKIKKDNQLTSDKLSIGQKLTIK